MQAGNTASSMLLLGPGIPDAPETTKIATPPTRKRRFCLSRCSKPQGERPGQSHPPCRCRIFGFPGAAEIRPRRGKNLFFRLPFFGRNFDPSPGAPKSTFLASREGPGVPGSTVVGSFLVFFGVSPVLFFSTFFCSVFWTLFRRFLQFFGCCFDFGSFAA